MKKQSLNGVWTLDIPGIAFGPVPAQVPGSVYHDLLCQYSVFEFPGLNQAISDSASL
ncbi:MAG: hypothetical protein IJI13_06560 [Oscillospiraceae bacterium]|nr:hypothetical protein [Oscillospiraceae bacterium]